MRDDRRVKITSVPKESGITTCRVHAHNGYYAGDFSSPRYDNRISSQLSNVLAA